MDSLYTYMYIPRDNKSIMMCRHKSFERMTNEREREVFVKSTLLGNGRQISKRFEAMSHIFLKQPEFRRSAVGLCQKITPTCRRGLIANTPTLLSWQCEIVVVAVVVVVVWQLS